LHLGRMVMIKTNACIFGCVYVYSVSIFRICVCSSLKM